MCGIAGISGPGATRNIVAAMVESIAHRGPDGTGLRKCGDTYLGHARLSVIDLVTGDQPMTNDDESVWVVYNGEIYNFAELREQLADLGHSFRTSSDTEVLVHGYRAWGLDLLPRLDGMFGFALWDDAKRRLVLARDLFGIKPVHYHFDGKTLRFASEVKAIVQDPAVRRDVDFQALHWFMNLRYIPGERTLFEGVRRLRPGHWLIFENGRIRTARYAELALPEGPRRDEGHYIEGIRHYLSEAVRKQMVSDVPLGVYLSGGLDSSAIVAMMSRFSPDPVRTFAMGFNEPTDELDDARIVADHFGTAHQELTLDPEPLRHYPAVIWATEEPKENILQGYLLSQFAREHVKVVHGGLGGDELFAGYINNRFIYPTNRLHGLVPRSVSRGILSPASRGLFRLQNASGALRLDEYRRAFQLLLSIGDPCQYYLILRNTWDYDRGGFRNLYGPAWEGRDVDRTHTQFDRFFGSSDQTVLEQALWTELHTKLVDDFLLNEDRTSMCHGLEVRVPFLDRDLVQFALTVPVDLRIKGNETKYIFRKAMEGLLPAHALRKKKWGFSFNPYYQFQKDLKFVAERVLTRKRVEERGWFNHDYLQRILDHPPHPRLRWHYFILWLVLGLEIWCRMFLDQSRPQRQPELDAYF
jgi:asparagine synthase (glutamine-hydrolysing)